MSHEYRATVVKHRDFAYYVNTNDHSPPHFHVRANGETSAFFIETGKRWPRHQGLKGRDKIIKKIWNIGKHDIAAEWNETRLPDSPRQLFVIPDSWGIAPTRDQQKKAMFDLRWPDLKKISDRQWPPS